MAGTDVSFYNAPKPDPYAGVNNAISMANGIAQNKILGVDAQRVQQQLGADQAVGQAYQSAFDPNTGQVNPSRLGNLIAGNPSAALAAPSAYANTAALQGANTANTASKLNLASGQMNSIYSAFGPLLTAGKPPARSDLVNAAANQLSNGSITPQAFNAFIHEVPLDDKGAAAYAQNKFGQTLSPGQQASPETIGINAQGQSITGTAGQAFRAATGGMAGSNAGFTGALPAGQQDVLAANEKSLFSDQQASSGIMQNVRPLQASLPLIQELNHSAFGPGSTEFNKVKAGLETAGIIPPGTADTAVRQEANKYLQAYAGNASTAGRSDQALSQALKSNPSLDLTQGANLDLIRSQIARDRQDASLPLAYNAENPTRQNASSYSGYKSNFYQKTDPRAFSFDLMTPDERSSLQKSLGAKDSPAYKKFVYSYQLARQAGMYTPQQGATSGQ